MIAPTPTTDADPGAQIDGEPQTQAAEGNDTGDRENGSQGHNREARYRVERNEARHERDAALARVEQLQTRELLRLAGEHLAQPGDLLTLGEVTLTGLLDHDGNVDPEAVADAAAALVEARPGLAKNPKVLATDPTQGHGGSPGRGQPDWADLLK